MFPNTMAAAPGSYVGVVLSSDLPESDRQLFEDHLSQLTDLRLQVPEAALQVPAAEQLRTGVRRSPSVPWRKSPPWGPRQRRRRKRRRMMRLCRCQSGARRWPKASSQGRPGSAGVW
ncbi:hypothetical protein ANANG_G00164810 [Anguilla anguilla]|uniref:Uncharacterized protein n=1 Tax=Anguilla anguilla TaxID=7936 RepID=A0A9D3MAV7_ANGAN|nr:hypothetical protein ANANG_G00164810 [Anguilla anguilla]